jgi:hypothetical protein
LPFGDRHRSFQWLTKAFDHLGVDPRFDDARDDLRFRSLISRLGLP